MNLVKFHKLGRQVQRRMGNSSRGDSIIDQMHHELELPKDMLYKARDFSIQFSKVEASRLEKLGLTRSQVGCVLKLHDKALQMTFLNKAAEADWSVKKLRAKIQAVAKVRPFGGRSLEVKSITEIVHELRILCKRTVAYVNQLEEQDYWGIPAETAAKLVALKSTANWIFNRILDRRPD